MLMFKLQDGKVKLEKYLFIMQTIGENNKKQPIARKVRWCRNKDWKFSSITFKQTSKYGTVFTKGFYDYNNDICEWNFEKGTITIECDKETLIQSYFDETKPFKIEIRFYHYDKKEGKGHYHTYTINQTMKRMDA